MLYKKLKQNKRYQKFLVCSEDQSGEEFDYYKEYLLSVELDQAAINAGFIAEPVGMVSAAGSGFNCQPNNN